MQVSSTLNSALARRVFHDGFHQAPQAMDGLSRAEKAVKANVHVDRIGEGASQNATGPCHHFIEDSRDDTP